MLFHSFDLRRVISAKTCVLAFALKSLGRGPGDEVGVA